MAAPGYLVRSIFDLVNNSSKYIALLGKAPESFEQIIDGIRFSTRILQALGNTIKNAGGREVEQSILDVVNNTISNYEAIIEELTIFSKTYGNRHDIFDSSFEWVVAEHYHNDLRNLEQTFQAAKLKIRNSV